MPMPNGGLITETNRQYYEGVQSFVGDGAASTFTTTFNTNLVFYSYDPTNENYPLNNFKLYASADGGLPGTFEEYIDEYTVTGNSIDLIDVTPSPTDVFVVQLKILTGGNYGDEDAFGNIVEENYGGYQYTKLNDVINSFMVAYVGNGKLIPDVKRTDVIFHAKRAMQEFSYDTLKSIKSQELTIPHSLSVVLPQDYVNYVGVYWVDRQGVKHPIYPANNLTSNPSEAPLQDDRGVPMQDQFNNNIETEPIIEERWRRASTDLLNGTYLANGWGADNDFGGWYYGMDNFGAVGRQYGLDPQYAQGNGWFTINDREGKMSFSSNLHKMLITLDYISDGLAYDLDSRVPKMAEEAMYAYILHAIVSTRRDSPEYLVQRLNREKFAKLRNTKIRLSNIKLHEIVQVMRGKSKWIKH
jgi:hypothetical protein